MWPRPDLGLRERKEIDVSTFHIHDTNLHDPNRADRFRRDAEMHRLLKGSGATRRPTIGRRLSHALRRR
jgi:hypothetical protein